MITLLTGCMFAGKSRALIDNADSNSAAFIPDIDTRSGTFLVSRDYPDKKVPAYTIHISDDEDLFYHQLSEAANTSSKLIIDEVQFLPLSFISVISRINENYDKDIICAGLLHDYKQHPFLSTVKLAEISNKIFYLNSLCSHCGKPNGSIVMRKSSNNQRIVIGSDDYYSLCYDCYSKGIRINKGE